MSHNNIKQYKIKLRQKYRELRGRMEKREKAYRDRNILKKFMSIYHYKRNDIIFTYISKEIEVSTIGIIKKAWEHKKKVAVPKCIKDTRQMDFYLIESFHDLEVGAFGVLEPITSKCKKVTDFSRGICIVPGFSFDLQGFRLGYGKGYYDRFLPRFRGLVVGLCYESCVDKKLPHGYFDRPVQLLITDKRIRRTSYKKSIGSRKRKSYKGGIDCNG